MPKRHFIPSVSFHHFFYYLHSKFKEDAVVCSENNSHWPILDNRNNHLMMKNFQSLKLLVLRVFPITALLVFLTSLSGIAQTRFTGKLVSDSGTAVSGAT